eukprot:TRINITY_DN2728_c2_g1_i1.p1 TRINITY_DN2728_c2_g1~~TRINITY_DN2728_c2_g1_i1.p1  ORF type:complete len:325 (+),score=56.48 TRINITY_DN2728_c2_g1_i1:30-977(+)
MLKVQNNRLDAQRVTALIQANWPKNESAAFDGTMEACEDVALPKLASEPSKDLSFLSKSDLYQGPCPEGVNRDVMRLFKKSHVRTPLVWHSTEIQSSSWHKMSDLDGEPYDSIRKLAEPLGIEIDWVRLGTITEAVHEECLAKLSSALNEGKWLYIVEKSFPHQELYREIGRRLITLEPEALEYPFRERFRLWVKMETGPEEVINLNANSGNHFPRIFLQNVIVSSKRKTLVKGAGTRKIAVPKPSDPYGHPEFQDSYNTATQKQLIRTMKGKDSDDESDNDWLEDPNCPHNIDHFIRANDFAQSAQKYSLLHPE